MNILMAVAGGILLGLVITAVVVGTMIHVSRKKEHAKHLQYLRQTAIDNQKKFAEMQLGDDILGILNED